MNEHVKIHTDSAIVINRIVQILNDNEIRSLVKDNIESARLAGFGSSYFDVELYVDKSDIARAEKLIRTFLEKDNEQ
jgi:hypothetical protein